MSEMATIPKGAIIYMSEGCYSDYGVQGVFRTLEAIFPNAVLSVYLKDRPKQREEYQFQPTEFLAYLAQQGMIEQLPAIEWHLGDYNSVGSDSDGMWLSGGGFNHTEVAECAEVPVNPDGGA